MADKMYPIVIDAPTTVNKTKSYQLPLNVNEGKSFRINRLFIQSPDLDAIAAADQIGIMLSKVAHNEQTSFLECISNEYIMSQILDFHLAEAALTGLDDPNNGLVELTNFRGVFLNCSIANYITQLQTGQDGAIDMNVLIEGGYTSKDKSDYSNAKF